MILDPILVEHTTLDGVKSRLLDLSTGLYNFGDGSVVPAGNSVTTGAGQCAASMDEDVHRFAKSWKLYLEAVSDDCSIVGNSVGQARVDFLAVDAAMSCVPLLVCPNPLFGLPR
jgi:hypothetical protein